LLVAITFCIDSSYLIKKNATTENVEASDSSRLHCMAKHLCKDKAKKTETPNI
jgi:hypothetical protein